MPNINVLYRRKATIDANTTPTIFSQKKKTNIVNVTPGITATLVRMWLISGKNYKHRTLNTVKLCAKCYLFNYNPVLRRPSNFI